MLWFFLLSYLTLHYCCISFLWCIHASLTLSLCSFAQTFDNVRFIDPVQNGVWGSDNFYCKGVESGVASGNTFPIPPCFANKTSNWMKTLLYRVPKSQLSSKTAGVKNYQRYRGTPWNIPGYKYQERLLYFTQLYYNNV